MSTARVYLDHQATTPCDPRVVQAMLPWFIDRCGNPGSVEHAAGREAAVAVEQARAEVAGLIGAEPREIVFTSGATEANNLAIKGAARFARAHADPRRRIITAATEHACVLDCVRDLGEEGFEPVILPVQPDGLIDPDRLRAALTQAPTLLVSVMAVNNEIGVIQDLPALASLAHAAGALFHTDAAQAAGRIRLDVAAGIDLLSLSAHKLYGPKGVGALYHRRRPRVRLAPLFSGGGQERGYRSGTLPTPLIVGFGHACVMARNEAPAEQARIARLRDDLQARLRHGIAGLTINGSLTHRIAGNLNITLPCTPAEQILRALPWLCVSTGSACASAEHGASHVLRALGLGEDAARRSLRLGLGRTTSHADIVRVAAALIEEHARMAGPPAAASRVGEAACPR